MEAAHEFPIGDTVAHGVYRVDAHLQGRGLQQLFRGRAGDGGEVLIVVDKKPSTDRDAFMRENAYVSPGVFALEVAGNFDEAGDAQRRSRQRARWALVERVTDGRWLPSILGTHGPDAVYESEPRMLPSHEPRKALANAVSLGGSAGRILAAAADAGVLLARVRPEYMWARSGSRGLEVTGLSARGDAFFAMSRVDAVMLPVFDRYYYAPETQGNLPVDDRALVFALAIMIAEWATGMYPFATKYHPHGALAGRHATLELPPPLASLLSRSMHLERRERPTLATFLEQLESIRVLANVDANIG